MIRLYLLLIFSWFFSYALTAQLYDDYIGAGHNQGISTFSSSEYQLLEWEEFASSDKTLSGAGLEGKLTEASRFLKQASLGANLSTIEHVADIGIENWIEEQFNEPQTYFLDVLIEMYDEVYQFHIEGGNDPNNFPCRPRWQVSNYAWWQMELTNQDLLRHRVALALSEILVISKQNSDIREYGYGVASYYDVLIRNAFGNFKDILREVSLHPAMGRYLSHFNNPKSIPEENIFPDENYAREVMQLFSIGLYELNEDGSWMLNGEGKPIPTYDDIDIGQMAKIFTGLGAGDVSYCGTAHEAAFGLNIRNTDMTTPMAMYDDQHEQGEKILLDGSLIPAGQTGMEDFDDAINYLFNHQNVGPFIGRLLIQRLVKSNPSPAYITAVSQAFNDNGSGVRGDMKTVVQAILLHPEARSCTGISTSENGKLKEPTLRFAQFAKAVNEFSEEGRYWNTGDLLLNRVGHHPLHAPSVFNFYLPDFQPIGRIADANLVAPEFQLHNTKTSVGYVNEAYDWTIGERLLYHYQGPLPYAERIVNTNIFDFMAYSSQPEVLLNKLDLLLTNGQLSERLRTLLRTKLLTYTSSSDISERQSRVKAAMFLLLISPDYTIQK